MELELQEKTPTQKLEQLTTAIINGRRLGHDDDLSFFLTVPLEALKDAAYRLQEHFCGHHVDLCSIINGKSGHCGENCKYCAQAACNHTGVDVYGFLPEEEILAVARKNEKAGVNRFSIVTSGGRLSSADFEKALAAYRRMKKELHIDLCASHGMLSSEDFVRLRQAGVISYHHNIETSRRFFPHICTTHTYDDRIQTIQRAQAAGLEVCSGGIIGMGETWQDRIDMALALAELKIYSIPINALMPIKGTPLADRKQLTAEEILRTIAIFRFINPEANIRLGAGRRLLPEKGAEAFMGGASASITGDMLTTTGTTIRGDLDMLHRLGLSNREMPNVLPLAQ